MNPIITRLQALEIPQFPSNSPVPPQSRITRATFIALYYLSRQPIPCLIISTGLFFWAQTYFDERRAFPHRRSFCRTVKIIVALFCAFFFLILPTQRDELWRYLTTTVKA